jgi:hypothetical protein
MDIADSFADFVTDGYEYHHTRAEQPYILIVFYDLISDTLVEQTSELKAIL